MFFLFSIFESDNRTDLVSRVAKAASDEKEFASLTNEFASHNRYIASQITGRFITESDDEWSVVLLAFYEAVKKYDQSKGSFTAFSDLVIRRRLTDHMRSVCRTGRELSFDSESADNYDDENCPADPASIRLREEAKLKAQHEQDIRDIRAEIEDLDRVLNSYGISFRDLPEVSPKASKTQKACARTVMTLISDHALWSGMKNSGRLPAKEISKRCGIPLKLLDKHRKYIIAVTEIMTGEYSSLQEFTAEIPKLAGTEK